MSYTRYGSFDQLRLTELPVPQPGERQVLIRVQAAGLHVADCFCVKGSPFVIRLTSGLRRPKYGVPGMDLAGIVEAVGARVTRFRPGDEVFGAGSGTCAEYSLADERHLAAKPADLGFPEAASLPTSGLAALHGVRDACKAGPGTRLLINGASGGVGSFAVQIAKHLGAHVTGVCSTRNTEFVTSLGADEIVDYTREDFTKTGPYDAILDNIENRTLEECRQALTPRGTLVLNSGTGASGLAMFVRLVKPLVLSPFAKQNLRRYLSSPNPNDLDALRAMAESGILTPSLDRIYPLAETAEALAHIDAGHARGKVVVTI